MAVSSGTPFARRVHLVANGLTIRAGCSVSCLIIHGARSASAVRPQELVCPQVHSFPQLATHSSVEITPTGTLTHPTPTSFTNDGERDMAASPPSQFLLFRKLKADVNEEVLAKGVMKLAAPSSPTGASSGSIKRVLLVRDRRTNESWRFGFAEFSTPQEAQKAFKLYESMEKFTISSKPIKISYIHPGVFVPVYNAPHEAERFTFLPLIPVYGGIRLAYWDEEGYVSELVLNTEGESPQGEESNDTAAAEKKLKKRKAEAAPAASVAENPAAKKTSLPSHLQFWQNRHSELHGGHKVRNQPENASGTTSSESTSAGPAQAGEEDKGLQESFADLNKLACLLCSRVFKTAEKLHQHERVSELHATNLNNPTLCESARKKLLKNTAASSEYRDRAKERRQVFGPSTDPSAPSSDSRNRSAKSSSPETHATTEPINKGAALLGKMGWTQGKGLGATGEGRTEHVIAEKYTAGAGLGMIGAKVGDVEEVAKAGGGRYDDFVKRTKDRAKERYVEME